jgi:hypothetical protein
VRAKKRMPNISERSTFAMASRSARLTRRLCGLLAVVLFAVSTRPAPAQEQDVFTVANVAVDVTAETATQARARALAGAHGTAFAQLIGRLVPTARRAEVPALAGGQLESFVRDFEIAGEKTSPVRYIASLTFRFKPDSVRQFLRRANIPFAETQSKPMVVLPVYRLAGAYLLWDDPNPWREAWHSAVPVDGLVPIVVPPGDLADIGEISAEQAVRGRSDRLRAIAGRYGASDVALALATPGIGTGGSARALQVTTTRFGLGGSERTTVRNYSATGDQALEDLIVSAARSTSDQIQEEWKQENLLRPDAEAELIAAVPVSDITDLVDVERRLSGIGVVRRVVVVSVTRSEARLRLQYVGDRDRLAIALAQKDLSLVGENERWTLRSTAPRREAGGSEAGSGGQ